MSAHVCLVARRSYGGYGGRPAFSRCTQSAPGLPASTFPPPIRAPQVQRVWNLSWVDFTLSPSSLHPLLCAAQAGGGVTSLICFGTFFYCCSVVQDRRHFVWDCSFSLLLKLLLIGSAFLTSMLSGRPVWFDGIRDMLRYIRVELMACLVCKLQQGFAFLLSQNCLEFALVGFYWRLAIGICFSRLLRCASVWPLWFPPYRRLVDRDLTHIVVSLLALDRSLIRALYVVLFLPNDDFGLICSEICSWIPPTTSTSILYLYLTWRVFMSSQAFQNLFLYGRCPDFTWIGKISSLHLRRTCSCLLLWILLVLCLRISFQFDVILSQAAAIRLCLLTWTGRYHLLCIVTWIPNTPLLDVWKLM